MAKNEITPEKNVYRLSDAFIKRWTRILITILLVGIGGGLVVMVVALIVYGDVPSDELPDWVWISMGGLFIIGFGVPLILGAILGGLAIHRFGWIPLLLAMAGLLGMGVSQIDGYGFLTPYCITAMILGVVGIFVLAINFTNVPIWLQLPILKSPRLYLRKGKKK